MRKYFKIVSTILKVWLFIGAVLFGTLLMLINPRHYNPERWEQYVFFYLPTWFFIFMIIGVLTLVLFLINRAIEKKKGALNDMYEQQYSELHTKNSNQYDQMYEEWKRIQDESPDDKPKGEEPIESEEMYEIENSKSDDKQEKAAYQFDDDFSKDDTWYKRN